MRDTTENNGPAGGPPAARWVALVGAGPGDKAFLTLRGLDLLRDAQVVIYDALANPSLLDLAPPDALRLHVGKRPSEHRYTQDQINQLLLEHAQAGRRVVRLKGGDPLVFGRGAEEAAFLAAHGFRCEVVPGVTAGVAVPAAAGIAVTHRRHSSMVVFLTGHEDPEKPAPQGDAGAEGPPAVDFQALARLVRGGATLVIYMGVSRWDRIAGRLLGGGLPGDTPTAVVQWGCTPRQRSLRATLAELGDALRRERIGSPAIIVVGAAAGFEQAGLDGYTSRPLFGQRIVITRSREQASMLRDRLEALGAEVLEAPTLRVVPPSAERLEALDAALREIQRFHWAVLTSVNGVRAVADRMEALGLDARSWAGVRVAAVGAATAEALWAALRVRPDLVPESFVAESLAAELLRRGEVAGKRLLLLRADIARQDLPAILKDAGGEAVDLCVYETKREDSLPAEVIEALRAGSVDWVTFTSSSTARNLVDMLGDERGLLARVKRASIGPVTSATLREAGLEPTVEASRHDIAGLVEAMSGEPRA